MTREPTELAAEAEDVTEKRDLSTLYKVTRTLSGKMNNSNNKPVKHLNGNPIANKLIKEPDWLIVSKNS